MSTDARLVFFVSRHCRGSVTVLPHPSVVVKELQVIVDEIVKRECKKARIEALEECAEIAQASYIGGDAAAVIRDMIKEEQS